MNGILTAVAAILIFAVLIFVHELGHFIAAKASGVKVNEFALGMGPKIFKKQKGETLYSVRLFPIGGFCAMEGEDEKTDDERSFSAKKTYVRLIVLVAGALMNILLGFVLLVGVTSSLDSFVVPSVETVINGSAAQKAGLMAGDEIISANGRRVHIMEDFSWEVSNNKASDGALELVVKNNGGKRNVNIVPDVVDGKASYGIKLNIIKNSFTESVKNSFYKTGFYSRVVIDSLIDLVTGKASISQLSGPVGIVHEIGTAVETAQTTGADGIRMLIMLSVLLTINLGVFNLLPLPALDGGRILFVIIEIIRRKPVPVEKEAIVHFVGIVLLILLSIVIAFKDIFTIW